VYLATTASGSFSRLTNSVASNNPYPMVKVIPDNDDVYVSAVGGASVGDVTNTFDGTDVITVYNANSGTFDNAGTPIPWLLVPTNVGTFSPDATIDASVGNPTYCARWNPTSGTQVANGTLWQLNGRISNNLEPNTINNITFDYWVHTDIASQIEIVVTIVSDVPASSSRTFNSLVGSTWTTIDVMVDASSDPFPIDVGRSGIAIDFNIFTRVNASSAIDASIETVDIRFDNIIVNVDNALGTGSTLYVVADFDGTDGWIDVSPVAGEAPERPHDLAVDLIDPTVINTHVATSNKWYNSVDSGANWTTEATDDEYRVFYTSGTSILVAGTSSIRLALDGSTFENKTGNLATALGTIGTIKRIMAL
jgi:hypothetical protein